MSSMLPKIAWGQLIGFINETEEGGVYTKGRKADWLSSNGLEVDNEFSTVSTELQGVQKAISETKYVEEELNHKDNRRNDIILIH